MFKMGKCYAFGFCNIIIQGLLEKKQFAASNPLDILIQVLFQGMDDIWYNFCFFTP